MGRTDQVSRLINASPARIYNALIDPSLRLQWLPPTGMSASFESFDLSVGGGYRMVLRYNESTDSPGKSSADSDVVEATFKDLRVDERVVEEIMFESDDPAYSGRMTMTWNLESRENGTEVKIVAADVPRGISAFDHEAGMNSSLENLARFLEK